MSGTPSTILIRGGRVLDPGRGLDTVGDVLIRNGRVVAAGPAQTGRADLVIQAAGLVVCPGFVDLHTHLREPGLEHKETIATGTLAAARGGFTTVCAMPNTEPAADTRSVVEFVLRRAAEAGHVRVLPVGAVTKGRAGRELAELGELAEAGAVAFSDDGSPVADAGLMRRALEYASAFGLPVSDHCETPELARGGVMHEGWVATRLGLRGQPAAAEESMVARDLQLAELTGARVHIAHVSTAGAVELIRRAKERGVPVTAEVTPHHLTLTHEAVAWGPDGADGPLRYDTNARVNPPLRSRADVEACVQGLRDGTIDAVATDHAPHALVDKQVEFDLAAPGISNLETALAQVLTLVHAGLLDLPALVERLTAGPVRAWGLDRWVEGLGTLREGAPADVTVFDPDEEWTVDPTAFASKGRNTPLAGVRLRGRVVATVAGGRLVYAAERVGT
ncbi:MAG TPA: dihydroorotase [Dehalococcoidia bacterium]